MSAHEPERKRGIKRKRPDRTNPTEEELSTKLSKKLHHAIRELRKTAKKAKSFETQKLLKKLRDLRQKEATAAEIEDVAAQADIMKHISLDPIADTALKTKINKDRILSSNDHIKNAVSTSLSSHTIPPATPGSPLAKVQSRLLSSKLLASEISSVIESMKGLVNPLPQIVQSSVAQEETDYDDVPVVSKKKVRRLLAADHSKSNGSAVLERSDGDDEHPDGDEGDDNDGWESGTISVGDRSSEEEWESGDIEQDGSQEDTDESSDSDDEKITAPKSRERSRQDKSTVASSQSTFLPSLAVGFTRGDTDSEWSDNEANIADSIRKNRRGQRARRAIWEKKYGKNANHMTRHHDLGGASKHEHTGEHQWGAKRAPGRHGSDPAGRRGAIGQYHQPFDAGTKRYVASGSQHRSDNAGPSHSRPPSGGSQRDERPLHPSWEAKKKLKNANIVPSQGTKIVFT